MPSYELFKEILAILGNIALIAGLPFAIAAHILERRKERDDAIFETYVLLDDSYMEFVRLALSTPGLQIWDKQDNAGLSDADLHQKWALFEMLTSLFARAYQFGEYLGDSPENARRRRPWESFMRRWCAREDFAEWLPELVQDEDPDFAAHILAVQASVVQRPPRRFGTGPAAS